MEHSMWIPEDRKYLICVDSYQDMVMKGKILSPFWGTESFQSLSQFLVKMEELLDFAQSPQAFTEPRTFSRLLHPEDRGIPPTIGKGTKVTFELQVIFRQHTSWQGILIWKDKRMQHYFRSVLELILLMDGALRSVERSGCA